MSFPILYLVSEWVIRLGMLPVVAHRRRLISALAWLAVIFFQPWIGALLFFLTEGWASGRIRKHARMVERTRTVDRLAFEKEHAPSPPVSAVEGRLADLIRTLGGFSILEGNEVRVMSTHADAVEAVLQEVQRARRHVHLLFYTFRDDRTGRTLARGLADAAARGVSCRVLADAVGSRPFFGSLGPWLRERGVEVERAFPVRLLGGRFGPPDIRNHRKLVVVDGRVAFTGSLNVGDPDGWGGPEPDPWRDVFVRIEGPTVRQLQLVFVEDWSVTAEEDLSREAIFPDPTSSGSEIVQVVPSGPTGAVRKQAFRDLVVTAFHGARERIVITTPYLIPDEVTEAALALAARRGVRVDVVVPSASDSRFVTAASRAHYLELLDAGIRVHEHQEGFLHSKTVTVDHALALLGSANFDRRSFELGFELTLLFYGPESVDEVVAVQNGYLDECREVDPEIWRARPLHRQLIEDVAKLASPLL